MPIIEWALHGFEFSLLEALFTLAKDGTESKKFTLIALAIRQPPGTDTLTGVNK